MISNFRDQWVISKEQSRNTNLKKEILDERPTARFLRITLSTYTQLTKLLYNTKENVNSQIKCFIYH